MRRGAGLRRCSGSRTTRHLLADGIADDDPCSLLALLANANLSQGSDLEHIGDCVRGFPADDDDRSIGYYCCGVGERVRQRARGGCVSGLWVDADHCLDRVAARISAADQVERSAECNEGRGRRDAEVSRSVGRGREQRGTRRSPSLSRRW
jgi:hypothetical protein